MKLHGNAASLSARPAAARRRVLEQGWTLAAAAEAAGVSGGRCSKWVAPLPRGGRAGAARSLFGAAAGRHRTAEERVEVIAVLRRLRMTAAEIAETLSMPLSTVSAVLTRIGLGRLAAWAVEPPNRYERRGRASSCTSTSRSSAGSRRRRPSGHRRPAPPAPAPSHGARSVGWEYVHVCVDDADPARLRRGARRREGRDRRRLPPPRASRIPRYGIQVERVITDNGSAYSLHRPRARLPQLGIQHLRTRALPARRPTARPVSQDRGAVRLDGEAARSRRSDSGKRHVEEAL